MNREQQRAMRLAGTVSVPQRFPQLAIISFATNGSDSSEHEVSLDYLAIVHVINAKLRIRRSFRTCDVAAIFLPWSGEQVDLQCGDWFLGSEIIRALPTVLDNRGGVAQGIAYVPEQAATLMEVEVGMTAAESVDYYPPLPDDRSVDHYAMGDPGLEAGGSENLWDPCTDSFARDPCSQFARPEKPGRLGKEKEQSAAWDPCTNLFW